MAQDMGWQGRIREHPLVASAISLLLVGVPVGLAYWRGFADDPFFPTAWNAVSGMKVPPPLIGHVLVFVAFVGLLLFIYVVVTAAIPPLRQHFSEGQPTAATADIWPTEQEVKAEVRVSEDLARPQNPQTMNALYHTHFRDLLGRARAMTDRMFEALPQSRRGDFRGLKVQLDAHVSKNGFLSGGGARIEQCLNEGQEGNKTQLQFGNTYRRYRRCMFWIVLVADLLDYKLAEDEAYRTLVGRDRELRAGVARLIEQDGYAKLRRVVTEWMLHDHDDIGFQELAKPPETDGSQNV